MGLEVKPPKGPFPTLDSLVHAMIVVHPIIMDTFNQLEWELGVLPTWNIGGVDFFVLVEAMCLSLKGGNTLQGSSHFLETCLRLHIQ